MAIMTIFARAPKPTRTANAVPISDDDGTLALPAAPAPAYTTSSARAPLPADRDDEDDCTDAVDDFFGVTYTREERRARRLRLAQEATHASRHDAPVYISEPVSAMSAVVDEKAALPAYATWEKDLENASIAGTLPEYCEAETGPEPFSIPQGLHKWGFCTSLSPHLLSPSDRAHLPHPVLPLFWFLGALLLINFHSPTELVPRFTPEESALRVSALRRAERRWARRCLLAWTIFTFFALAAAGITYGIVMSLKN